MSTLPLKPDLVRQPVLGHVESKPPPPSLGGGFDIQPGQTVASKYRIVRALAKGGMGAVYEAENIHTSGRCALKIMLPEQQANSRMLDRFWQEAKLISNLKNDHIVQVMDAGVDEDRQIPYIVMEFLEGQTLRHIMKDERPLSAAEALFYLNQTAKALDAAHRRRIVHRDLKPENIFVECLEDGTRRVKVLDFGIAKVIQEGATENNMTNEIIGTIMYMAPEQFSRQGIRAETDIHALGMIAFMLLVGLPYLTLEARDGGQGAVIRMIIDPAAREPASMRARKLTGAELPAEFDTWFARATAMEARDRFPSALEAIRELSALFPANDRNAEAAGITVPMLSPPVFTSALRGETTNSPAELPRREAQKAASQAQKAAIVGIAAAAIVSTGGIFIGKRYFETAKSNSDTAAAAASNSAGPSSTESAPSAAPSGNALAPSPPASLSPSAPVNTSSSAAQGTALPAPARMDGKSPIPQVTKSASVKTAPGGADSARPSPKPIDANADKMGDL